jgi:3',5'-cyclic AMP phosphodiesterase CpdA
VSSSRGLWLVACCLLLVVLAGCEYDWGQFIAHPTVEDRVRENLSGRLHAPGPVAVNPDSFSFAMFGDPQVTHDNVNNLGRLKADVSAKGIAFFCALGDFTEHSTPDEHDSIVKDFQSVGIPYYAAIGNHELYQADGWEWFKTTFGPSCYPVVIADRVKLIFLDTADGLLGPAQFDWLESELDDGGRYIKIVGTHYSVFGGPEPTMWRMASTAERMKLQHLLQKYGVHSLVSGHIHGWRHMEVEGVNHFIVGTMAPGGLDYGTGKGYLLFTFAHDSLSWQQVMFE